MEEIKQFVIENWKEIIWAFMLVVGLIFTIVGKIKKGTSFADIVAGLLTTELPSWIIKAEASGETGEKKKVTVLNCALNYASKLLGRTLSEDESAFVITKVSEQIESILSTPQKKEESQQVKKSKYR